MSFAVPGCHCCHKKITHRLFDDAGTLLWSKRDPNANPGGDVNRTVGIALSKDPGNLWTYVAKTVGSVPSQFLQWDVSGVNDDSATLPESTGQGVNTQAVASDSSGNVYVGHFATSSHETIVKLDSSLNEVWRFTSPGHAGSRAAYYSVGLAVSPDESRIASITYLIRAGYQLQGRIAEHDPSDGSEIWSLTYNPTEISGGGESYIPMYTHYDPAGNLWVGFHASITVSGVGSGVWARIDSSGSIDRLATFAAAGPADELLVFASTGDVYVLTATGGSTGTVKKYDDTGSLLTSWTSEVNPDFVTLYRGITIDPSDNLYLFGNYGVHSTPRLVSYQLDGTKNWSYDEQPTSLASASSWALYATDGYVGIGGPVRKK